MKKIKDSFNKVMTLLMETFNICHTIVPPYCVYIHNILETDIYLYFIYGYYIKKTMFPVNKQ